MPKPGQWGQVEKPDNDSDYFERMARVIFMSGLNWATLQKKWPGIKTAFAGFDIDRVAALQEPDIETLMQNPEVIRNYAKIAAIVHNAREMQSIAHEHGSFANYLGSLRDQGGEMALREGIRKRFKFMGQGTTVIFLFSAGEDLPQAAKEWQARHSS